MFVFQGRLGRSMASFRLAKGAATVYHDPMMMLAYIGSPSQWFILLLLCLLVFGAKRLPDIARALGRSLGEFRKARREFESELMRSEHEADEPRPANPLPAGKASPVSSVSSATTAASAQAVASPAPVEEKDPGVAPKD